MTEALLEQKAIDVTYLSRSSATQKLLTLHPQGLVSRHSVTYMLATVHDYADIRQFALHRIKQAALSSAPWRAQEAFDIDAYIQGSAFGYRQGQQDVMLSADIARPGAWLLQETPLSEEQSIEPLPDTDWLRLTARVPDDQQTL
ncbi:hypothetical protein GCM10022228_11420 [Halomonas cibimaris]|uniref:WYL domain-containing protein n=1 Tax=Halomonas cibimaris TaxID=657012 RepID=A0ABP7LIV5_9GAMM